MEIKNDTLMVFCEYRKFKLDNLNDSKRWADKLKCPSKPDLYTLEKGKLKLEIKKEDKIYTEILSKKQATDCNRR